MPGFSLHAAMSACTVAIACVERHSAPAHATMHTCPLLPPANPPASACCRGNREPILTIRRVLWVISAGWVLAM